jgi:SAM-dependent methyltransferase
VTTRRLRPLDLPPPLALPHSDDFYYVQPWTTENLRQVIRGVTPQLGCFLNDLVLQPGALTNEKLQSQMIPALWLVQSLWQRSLVALDDRADAELPPWFSQLTHSELDTWRTLGPIAAAWCIVRLAVFGRRLHLTAVTECEHHSANEVTSESWRMVQNDDGAYLYESEIAVRYERDRRRDPEFIAAINTVAEQCITGREALEIGAGTGVITRMIAPHVPSIFALEPAIGMRRLLTRNCADLKQVTVRPDDIIEVRLDSNCIDVAFEHEALCFVDEPVMAVLELRRLLRPGGELVRIISSRQVPHEFVNFAAVFHSELRLHGHGRFRIAGKNNDSRLTNWLATDGIRTIAQSIARWEAHRSLAEYAAPLLHGGFPYLRTVPQHLRLAAAEAALRATGLHWESTKEFQFSLKSARSLLRK